MTNQNSPTDRGFSTLRRFARDSGRPGQEYCDLCGEMIPVAHRHLLNLNERQILCSCQACGLLFSQDVAGTKKLRLIPNRLVELRQFEMTDAQWDSLHIPVNMAFFTYSSLAGRVVAVYPGPAGPMDSMLELDAWEDLAASNEVLSAMAPDVEALLINRARGDRKYFLAPIDDCYRLVGTIRLYWKGLSGGQDVWRAIDQFFDDLVARAAPARSQTDA